MGLYDRDYGRSERTPWDRVENPRSILIILIVINVLVFVAQLLFTHTVQPTLTPEFESIRISPAERDAIITSMSQKVSYVDEWFAVRGSSLIRPWFWYQTLTYGFLHDIGNIFHLAGNMLVLFFFGRPLEQRFGGQRFLKAYLLSIVCGGFVAMLLPWVYGVFTGNFALSGITLGASGGVTAMLIIFAMLYPDQEALLFFVIPVKVRYLAIGIVVLNVFGVSGITGGNTAYEVHLAGALFGYLYVKKGWKLDWLNFDAITQTPDRIRTRSRRTKLKIHDPEKKIRVEAEEADRILAKIHSSGESSLTSGERKTLERYSRRQRQKREL